MAAGPSERLASGHQGNSSTAATTRPTATNSVTLESTYSPANNHYATTTAISIERTASAAPITTNTNGKLADIDSRQVENSNNNNWIQTAAIAAEARERRSTITETFLTNLLRGGKANRLLTCLLVAALCASVLNTLLLSFVIKSIQLNDAGFMNGKLAWNEQLAATTLNSKAKLPGKSLLVQSIESFGDDRALRIEKLSRASWFQHKHQQQQAAADDESLLFAIDGGSSGGQSNYMKATSRNSVGHVSAATTEAGLDRDSGMFEIGANSFALNLITATSSASQDEADSKRPDDNGDVGAHLPPTATERVLEFNGDRQSITLNREESLRLSPSASGSLAVEGELRSPSITGSLAQNLDLQTRDGQLLCSAERIMKLVSKSGAIQLASSDGIQLDSARVSLHSKRLLIPSGIRYFESEPPPMPTLGQESPRQHSSAAYELIVVNGLLMATS